MAAHLANMQRAMSAALPVGAAAVHSAGSSSQQAAAKSPAPQSASLPPAVMALALLNCIKKTQAMAAATSAPASVPSGQQGSGQPSNTVSGDDGGFFFAPMQFLTCGTMDADGKEEPQ